MSHTPPMYVVLRTCTSGREGLEIGSRLPDSLENARELVGHWREVARAGGRGCCRYDLMRLAPEHLWPLLGLTADELDALIGAADLWSDHPMIGNVPLLRSALDKLTGSTDA